MNRHFFKINRLMIRGAVFLITLALVWEGMARVDHVWRILYQGQVGAPPFDTITIRDSIGPRALPYAEWRWLKLNKYGFNDEDDYTYEKRAHRYRVLALGDSITMGSATNNGDWPRELEQELSRRGWDVEVINAAVPSLGYEPTLRRLEQEYYRFRPDAVIMYIDLRALMICKVKKSPLPDRLRTAGKKSAALNKLFLYRPKDAGQALLWQRWRFDVIERVTEVPESCVKLYNSLLNRLAETGTRHGWQPITVTLPTRLRQPLDLTAYPVLAAQTVYFHPWLTPEGYLDGLNKLNNQARSFSQKDPRLQIVDLQALVPGSPDYFTDNHHFTRRGNQQVAGHFADYLEDFLASKAK